MAINPRKLSPGNCVKLLNSTRLGPVLTTSKFNRHRAKAGFRLGEGQTIDLLRYIGWLRHEYTEFKVHVDTTPKRLATAYEAHKERAAKRQREMSLLARDIGELPDVMDMERRNACRNNFALFAQTYMSALFYLPWSNDHLKVISKIERAVLTGGLFAMAMPRASGKTTLCEIACTWSILYGHREFVMLIGPDEDAAVQMLESIKSELENNELLMGDFPEALYPIQKLEGIHQRAYGQLYNGCPTNIGWTVDELILPNLSDKDGKPWVRGGIIRVAGITGRIRGAKAKRTDGTAIRPSLVFLDDPQTDESARSPSQCAVRERVLSGAILGLAGPGKKIAGLMTLTVVRQDDMADRILTKEKYPEWDGERTKMVYKWPTDKDKWTSYADIWRRNMHAGAGFAEATEYYRTNREAMDDGAEVAWEARHNEDELSALQHAWNLRLGRKEHAFWAEYQNEPLPEISDLSEEQLTPDGVMSKMNGELRGVVPSTCSKVTAYMDIHGRAVYWVVIAWEEDFTGYIVDYGTEPDQGISYYTLRDCPRTLSSLAKFQTMEASIYAGLDRLAARVIGRPWKLSDRKSDIRVSRCIIDANWGLSTNLVYRFCRESVYSSTLNPSHGKGIGPAGKPMLEWPKKPGERRGTNWVESPSMRRSVRRVIYDTNYWKTFAKTRLLAPKGDPGSMTLFGKATETHMLIVDHLTAEYSTQTAGRGRTVDEWKMRADNRDNHFFDCVVGACVAASIEGVKCPMEGEERKRTSFASRYAKWQSEAAGAKTS